MTLIDCPTYFQSTEKGGSSSLRDACQKCGRTKEAHIQKSEVTIIFQGLQRTYASTTVAMEDGFYPVSVKREDYGRMP